MNYGATGEAFVNDYLEHYGVKGQEYGKHKRGKWQKHAVYAQGREDPNKGVEQSPSEKKSAFQKWREGHARRKKLRAMKARSAKLLKEREGKEAAKKREAEDLKKVRESNDPVLAYKYRDKLTTAELDAIINRAEKVSRLRSIAAKEEQIKKGKSFVEKMTDVNTKVNEVYKFANSPAGKELTKFVAKQLGFKPPTSFMDRIDKTTSISDIWKNRDKMTTKDYEAAVKRLKNAKMLEDMYEEWLKEQEKNKK